MSKIQKQIDYFATHQQELLDRYSGKAIVIPDSLDVTSFNSLEEGYRYGVKTFGYGNFLLKDCSLRSPQVQIISPIITVA